MGDFVGDRTNGKKIYFNRVKYDKKKGVLLCTFHICLVQFFSAQWREDMRKKPNVILGCFRGLGKK